MAFPYVIGHPDYSSTGANKFVPQVWSGKVLVKYYDGSVLPQITNTIYEGEIKAMGDTVIIRTIPNITVNDYYAGKKLTYERPSSANITLSIDKGLDWAIELDDVMKVQSDIPLLEKWTDDASMQLKIKSETNFFKDSGVYGGMASTHTGNSCGAKSGDIVLGSAATPLQLTSVNVLDKIIDAGTVLDESNVPEQGRWMVLPAWACAMIKKSDLKDASLTGDPKSVLRTGLIGRIDRFDIYASNLLYSAGSPVYWYALFGVKDAITFAAQITETEALRSPDTFADRVRGLAVYGYKAIKTDAFGSLIIKK